jgi:hypothetical protein
MLPKMIVRLTREGMVLGVGMVAAALVVIAIYYPQVNLANTNQLSLSLALGWLISAVLMLMAGLVTVFRSRPRRSE